MVINISTNNHPVFLSNKSTSKRVGVGGGVYGWVGAGLAALALTSGSPVGSPALGRPSTEKKGPDSGPSLAAIFVFVLLWGFFLLRC